VAGSIKKLLVVCFPLFALGCDDDAPVADAGDAAVDSTPVDTSPPEDTGPIDSACTTPIDATVAPVDAGPGAPPPELDCGPPTFPEGTGLRRAPYLQSVGQTGARVAWTTTSGGTGSLFHATDPAGPWTEVVATGELFETSRTEDTVEYVAHEVRLTGLTPNSAYCYRIEEDGVVLADNLRFDTAWEGSDRPVRIVAFGDSGQATPEQFEVRDRLLEREYDVFLHLGDMAYGSGTFPEFEQNVFDVYRDFMHRVPSFPTMGNHEFMTSAGQPYLDVYYLPEQALREEEQERYYSFDYGNVHFVSLDSNDARLAEILIQEGGLIEQTHDLMTDWLRADLAASDAEWKIAFFHHPPYTSSERGYNGRVIVALREALEEGGVDLVLSGHDHHYERMIPTRAGCAAPPEDGITYIIAGAGGAGLRDLPGREWMSAAAEDQVHSFLELDIHGCFAHGRAVSLLGDVIDDFWLDGCDD
jgi:hypothetical protein